MRGFGWGMGLRANSPHTPAGSPRSSVPLTGEQGWALRVECFCGTGWDLLPAGWFCSPRRWHLVGSLLRSPMDHLQRPEHPSPEAGPPSAVPYSAPRRGWARQQRLSGHHWGYAMAGVSVPSARGKSHLELVARGGPMALGEPSP